MRRPIIAGNWKMNKTIAGTKELVTELIPLVKDAEAEVVIRQTKGALNGISKEDAVKCVIAYEPVWAIGTGKTATSTDANATIKVIRDTLAEIYGKETAEVIRIQYGGSMNPKNVAELMSMPEIDGGLIGGASLKAVDFSQVVKY